MTDTYKSVGLDGTTYTATIADAQDVATYILNLPVQTQKGRDDLAWAYSAMNPAGAKFYVSWIFAYTLGLLPSWPTTDGAGNQILNSGYVPPNLYVSGSSYWTRQQTTPRTSKIT